MTRLTREDRVERKVNLRASHAKLVAERVTVNSQMAVLERRCVRLRRGLEEVIKYTNRPTASLCGYHLANIAATKAIEDVVEVNGE